MPDTGVPTKTKGFVDMIHLIFCRSHTVDRTDVPKLVAGGQIFRSGSREAQGVLSELPRIWLLKRYIIGK